MGFFVFLLLLFLSIKPDWGDILFPFQKKWNWKNNTVGSVFLALLTPRDGKKFIYPE